MGQAEIWLQVRRSILEVGALRAADDCEYQSNFSGRRLLARIAVAP